MQEINLLEDCMSLSNVLHDWPHLALYLESLAADMADSGDHASASQLWQAAETLIKISDRELPAVNCTKCGHTMLTLTGPSHCEKKTKEAATTRRLSPAKRTTRVLLHEPQTSHVSTVTRQPHNKRAASSHVADLTSRELEVLRLLAEGMTNPQIAHRLIISLHTVNAHVRSIFNKVGVNSRCAVTRYALEQSLL